MSISWVDFFWNWKRVQNRRTVPASGAYTIGADDTALDFTGSVATTWTLPAPNGGNAPKKIKNKGSGDLTLSGSIFLNQVVSTLILTTGDMVTLTDDGTYWSVGD